MNENLNISNVLIYFVYTLIISLPIFLSIVRKFDASRIRKLYNESIFYFSILIAFILKVNYEDNFAKKILIYFNLQNKLSDVSIINENSYPFFIGTIEILIAFIIIYISLNIIGIVIIFPIIKFIEKKCSVLGKLIDIVTGVFKGIFFAVILTSIIKIFSLPMQDNLMYKALDNLLVTPMFNSEFSKNIGKGLSDSLKIEVDTANQSAGSGGKILICNGVTLNEALKTNKEINNKADALTKNLHTDRAKAKALYNWIGNEVKYDNEKAKRISNEDFSIKSGAINTFDTRKGVCFDYACLYVVMAEHLNIKTRIVTGKGYSGKEWISHSWVEVYLREENKWIEIDPTFKKAGNYFDSKDFNKDHIREKVIWESKK